MTSYIDLQKENQWINLGELLVNRFQYDAHERRGSVVLAAMIAGFVGAMLVILAVKFTGFGAALVNPQVMLPPPAPAPFQGLVINNYEKSIIDVVNRVGP